MAIGPPGVGKSYLGNTAIGKLNHFKCGKSSETGITQKIESYSGHFFDDPACIRIRWWETAGMGDPNIPILKIIEDIRNSVGQEVNLDAILLVMKS